MLSCLNLYTGQAPDKYLLATSPLGRLIQSFLKAIKGGKNENWKLPGCCPHSPFNLTHSPSLQSSFWFLQRINHYKMTRIKWSYSEEWRSSKSACSIFFSPFKDSSYFDQNLEKMKIGNFKIVKTMTYKINWFIYEKGKIFLPPSRRESKHIWGEG